MQRVHRLPLLPPRPRDAHKNQVGRVLVLGGSSGMSGAPWLAARAALATSGGLVTIAVPEELAQGLEARATSTMTLAVAQDRDGGLDPRGYAEFAERTRSYDAVVVGCGMGQADGTARFLDLLLSERKISLVVDADALRLIAARGLDLRRPETLPVLTPHPGEMAALAGRTAREVQASRQEVAASVARDRRAIVVLKGDRSVVADGQQIYLNHTGNPGMAAAGSGDVLAGVIGSLRARGLGGFESACLGTHLHGLAGDLARQRANQESLAADDVLESLPLAMTRYLEAGGGSR